MFYLEFNLLESVVTFDMINLEGGVMPNVTALPPRNEALGFVKDDDSEKTEILNDDLA